MYKNVVLRVIKEELEHQGGPGDWKNKDNEQENALGEHIEPKREEM